MDGGRSGAGPDQTLKVGALRNFLSDAAAARREARDPVNASQKKKMKGLPPPWAHPHSCSSSRCALALASAREALWRTGGVSASGIKFLSA
ncbi:hypothetical protein EYF80_041128 [Liparis tanakae]|uniref:Uncharacterized protein n=1 Tax=Liparis tanakae TaxID=230148 RepID=A0A4Z2G5Z6_9TELE|nr:hypothetical protein EYF80_041128 [Liparis tanakae]